jgi:hypothetical protein
LGFPAKGRGLDVGTSLYKGEELRHCKKAREYHERAIGYLELARLTPNLDAQNRFIKIAQRYRALTDAEERDAESKSIERRSGPSDKFG